MNRIVISCGGTGGHLTPGIALAEGLVDQGHKCWLFISRKKVDERLVEKYPEFEFIKTSGLPFSFRPVRFVRFLLTHFRGFVSSFRLLRKLSPDLVVGFGGFGSAGVCAASALLRIPFVLHESNRVPGRAVRALRYLGPERVYLPPGVRLRGLGPSQVRHYGCPVRKEIQPRPLPQSRAALGMDEQSKLLVVFGGSQGASVLNAWAEENFEYFAHEGVSLYCVTGMGKGEERMMEAKTRSGAVAIARFVPFTDQVADLLSAADLVVARAGAGSIAELIRCRAPAILVPYPYAADNHQRANAAFFEQQGGGIVLDQDRLGDLRREVMEIIFNDWLLRKFRGNLQRMDRENGLKLILRDLDEISQDTRARNRERKLEGVQC